MEGRLPEQEQEQEQELGECRFRPIGSMLIFSFLSSARHGRQSTKSLFP